MRTIKSPTFDDEFKRVLERAQQLRDAHEADFESNPAAKISTTDHYKKFGGALLENQNHKCAYCESYIENQSGDVEHYRPKGRVADEDGVVVKIKLATGVEIEHPGYFWLSYEPTNLLMACIDCNRRRKHVNPDSGDVEKSGKADIFPVEDFRAEKPDDPIEKEKPLLLNPLKDDASLHFRLEAETGMLCALTDRGDKTIKILGLNRTNLRRSRAEAYQTAVFVIKNIQEAISNGNNSSRKSYERKYCEMRSGAAPHWFACSLGLQFLDDEQPGILDFFDNQFDIGRE